MLNLSLAAVAKGGERAQWVVPPDDPIWQGAAVTLRAPVRVEAEALPIAEGAVLVRGRLATEAEVACRRCLVPVQVQVDTPLELLFEPLGAEEAEALDGEVYALPARGDVLELGGAVREQLLLHLPEYVVCDAACSGLCPHCGAELNQVACACRPEPEPSPWDALKRIKFD